MPNSIEYPIAKTPAELADQLEADGGLLSGGLDEGGYPVSYPELHRSEWDMVIAALRRPA